METRISNGRSNGRQRNAGVEHYLRHEESVVFETHCDSIDIFCLECGSALFVERK